MEDTCVEAERYRGDIKSPRLAGGRKLGISRTTSIVKRNYVVKNMRRKVRAYVRTCDICQQGKADTHLPRGKMGHLEIPVRKWESVSVDSISLPETTSRSSDVLVDEMLTATDPATLMVVLIPCSSRCNAADLADNFWWEVVRYHGVPRSIISDRGPVFVSQFWTELMKVWTLMRGDHLRITHRLTVRRRGRTKR